jgi:hypothetical protein
MLGPISMHDYQWASPPTPRGASEVKLFIVHHSDGALTETVDQIHAQHLAQGWIGIGYHVIIYPNGQAIEGRPLGCVPAAAEDANRDSVDVCLIGDFEPGTAGYSDSPTAAQLKALVDVAVFVHQQFPTIERTIGHRDVEGLRQCGSPLVTDDGTGSVATACPGQTLYDWLPTLRQKVADALAPK